MVNRTHQLKEVPPGFPVACCVCKLEDEIQNIFCTMGRFEELECILDIPAEEITRKGGLYQPTGNIASCQDEKCTLHTHSTCVQSKNFIFSILNF